MNKSRRIRRTRRRGSRRNERNKNEKLNKNRREKHFIFGDVMMMFMSECRLFMVEYMNVVPVQETNDVQMIK